MAIPTFAAYKRLVEASHGKGHFTKGSVTFNGTAQAWNTSWLAAPDAGTAATATARICTEATAGALWPQSTSPVKPPLTAKYWLSELELQIAAATNRTNSGIFLLVDRLADILPSATANATVTPIANLALTGLVPTRHTTGENVMAAVYTQTVIVGAPQLTLTYTNQAGTAGRTSKILVPGAAQALSIMPFSLADGDTGVQSVQSYNITTAGTSGQFAVVLYKVLAAFRQPAGADSPGYREMLSSGALQELHPNACLEIWSTNIATSTTSGLVMGRVGVIEG